LTRSMDTPYAEVPHAVATPTTDGSRGHRLANDVLVDDVVADLQLDRGLGVGAGDDEVVADQRRANDLGVVDRDDRSVGAVAECEYRVAADHRERPTLVDGDSSP
jgi:hypothetical protein